MAATMAMTDFRGTRPLCQGGFSSVLLTTHIQTNQTCVLKILDRPSPASLQRETWCIDNLDHPHIVQSGAKVIQGLATLAPTKTSGAFMDEKGHHIMCFEHANGGDLFDFLDRNVLLEEDLARTLFKQLLHALEYLHGQDCCHLDIKTENILLHETDDFACQAASGELELKLADFGLAAVAALGDDIEQVTIDSGTERSMGPEIHTEDSFNGKHADMWSAGTILFNMLTGYPPCEIALTEDKSYRHIHNDNHEAFWRRFRKAADVSDDAMDLVNGLLQRDPSLRLTASSALKHRFFDEPEGGRPRSSSQYFCRDRHVSEGMAHVTTRTSLFVVKPELSKTAREPTAVKKYTREELEVMASEMRDFLDVKDRRYHFKVYRKCWLGREGVAYLTKILGSKMAAVAVGDQMIAQGLLRHVVGEHNLKDRELFYRFTQDEPSLALKTFQAQENSDSVLSTTFRSSLP
jgi:serine/threonine protein kinase